jgi:hypothetical protein
MGRIWVAFFLAVINAETLAFYGCFSNIISMRGEVSRSLTLGLGAGLGLLTTYRWCSEAQRIEQCVSSPITIVGIIIRWRGPAAIVNYRPVLSSERELQNNKLQLSKRKSQGEGKIGRGSQMGA